MPQIRVCIVAAMAMSLSVVASGAFDRFVWQLLLTSPIVTAAALAVRGRSWRIRVPAAVLAVAVATIVVGALAGAGIGGVASGVLDGPKRLLSTEWPSPRDPKIIVAIAFAAAVVAGIAIELAGRRRFHVAPMAVIAGGMALAMAIGAPLRPNRWVVATLGVLACALVLARPGDDTAMRTRTLLGDRSLPVTGVAVLGATMVVAFALTWVDRADPRRTTEAQRSETLIDPLEKAAALRAVDPPLELFRVTDRSTLIGPSLPSRWRIAALDTYDAQRWTPTITLRPIGPRLGVAAQATPDAPPPIHYELELLTDDFDIVPFPGRPLEIEAGDDMIVQTDAARSVVRLDRTPSVGATINAASEPTPTAALIPTTPLAVRQVDETANTFTDLARELGGEGTLVERIRRIESTMSETWQLDSRAPGAGQQLALIERFVNETRRGTEEQFVTAFVLLVRSLGVEARVATGFAVPVDELRAPLTLRSDHAATWPEIKLLDGTWVPFDPTPPEEASDADQPPPPPEEQSPAAPQPPIPPPAARDDRNDAGAVEAQSGLTGWANVRGVLARAGAVAGITLLPFVAIASTVLLLKWARRRRRMRHPNPARRVVGAWANATDSLIDAGLDIGRSWTDQRIAQAANHVVGGVPLEMRRLAASASAMTFGSTDRGPRLVDDAIRAARNIDDAIRSSRTRWERIRWRLSLRSLRSRTRSPII